MMKKTFLDPKMEIERFALEDVITTSSLDEDETPPVPVPDGN